MLFNSFISKLSSSLFVWVKLFLLLFLTSTEMGVNVLTLKKPVVCVCILTNLRQVWLAIIFLAGGAHALFCKVEVIFSFSGDASSIFLLRAVTRGNFGTVLTRSDAMFIWFGFLLVQGFTSPSSISPSSSSEDRNRMFFCII